MDLAAKTLLRLKPNIVVSVIRLMCRLFLRAAKCVRWIDVHNDSCSRDNALLLPTDATPGELCRRTKTNVFVDESLWLKKQENFICMHRMKPVFFVNEIFDRNRM
jgi:hypothetical protein